MIGVHIAFGILAGSIDGVIEGTWVNDRTYEGKPSLTKAQHRRLWIARFAIIGVYVFAVWVFAPLRRWEPFWVLLIAAGLWAPFHRLSMNITRLLEFPSIPWCWMSAGNLYDRAWLLLGHYRTAFLAACLTEIGLAVFAIYKLT